MSSLSVLDQLPDGYFVEETPRSILAVHSDNARVLHEHGYGPDSDGEFVESELRGRKPLFELDLGERKLLLRRFSHGGLLRWLTGRRFLDAERPFRELILSDSLTRAGIKTPQVVAARARSVGLGWELEVMTSCVDDTIDLGRVLLGAQRREFEVGPLRSIVLALGDLIRRMHLRGCLHADLQPKNVLVQRAALAGAPPELWLLDLDRSFFARELSDRDRRDNLRRLYRHVRRREEQRGAVFTRTDFVRFLRGYDPERASWKDDWRAVESRHSAGVGFHRLGWWLERIFARSPRKRGGRDIVYPPFTRPDG